MPSRKCTPKNSPVTSQVTESPKSLRSRRGSTMSSDAESKKDSPMKGSAGKTKLNVSNTKGHGSNLSMNETRRKSPPIVNFVDDAVIKNGLLIKDVRKIGTMRDATASLSSTVADDDSDHEALAMLGKYGNATKILSSRSIVHGKGEPDANKIGKFGFKTPTKKGQMFEKTQELLSSASKGTPVCISKNDSMSLSPKTSPTYKVLTKMTNTPSRNLTPARKALINSTLAKASSAHASPSNKKAHRNILGDINGTPTKSIDDQQVVKDTPLKQLALKASENSPPTPHDLRKRVTRNLEKLKDQSESESSDSSSEEEENMEEGKLEDIQNGSSPITNNQNIVESPTQSSQKMIVHVKQRQKITETKKTDLYFETHGKDNKIADRIHTSDNTLSHNLKTPLLSPDDLKTILGNERLLYQEDIDQLFRDHKQMFNKWMLWLQQGFSLMTYGLGSKRDLLSDFHKHISKFDPHAHVLVVNGYFPSLTLKHIFNAIINDLLDGANIQALLMETEDNPAIIGTLDQCEIISKVLVHNNDYLYLIIHNLDGLALRSDKTQGYLAKLASDSRISLVSSIDHVNAPLLWDADKRSKFNFVWYEATTFLPYTEETLNENSLMMQYSGGNSGLGQSGGGALALSSLSRVFESLTPNAKEIYLTIVRYQMEALDEMKKERDEDSATTQTTTNVTTYQGLSFKDLYRRCRKAFLVNSDLTLRAQLTEFRDHKLIRERKGVDDGIDYLIIPLNAATLTEFLDQRSQNEGR